MKIQYKYFSIVCSKIWCYVYIYVNTYVNILPYFCLNFRKYEMSVTPGSGMLPSTGRPNDPVTWNVENNIDCDILLNLSLMNNLHTICDLTLFLWRFAVNIMLPRERDNWDYSLMVRMIYTKLSMNRTNPGFGII